MTKAEIVEMVHRSSKLSKSEAGELTELVFETIDIFNNKDFAQPQASSPNLVINIGRTAPVLPAPIHRHHP